MGNWELGRRFKMVEFDPLTIWNIFFYFFGNYLRSDTDEKVDLGNNERPNLYAYVYAVQVNAYVYVYVLCICMGYSYVCAVYV